MGQVLLHMLSEVTQDGIEVVARLRHRYDVVVSVAIPRLAAHCEIYRMLDPRSYEVTIEYIPTHGDIKIAPEGKG